MLFILVTNLSTEKNAALSLYIVCLASEGVHEVARSPDTLSITTA